MTDETGSTEEILRSLDEIAGRVPNAKVEPVDAIDPNQPEQQQLQSPPPIPQFKIAAANMAIQSLVSRHGDAVTKIRQLEDHELALKLQLRRTADALDYQRKRERGIKHRIITGRAAIRADEDDAAGIYD